jgi:hypothetical protein
MNSSLQTPFLSLQYLLEGESTFLMSSGLLIVMQVVRIESEEPKSCIKYKEGVVGGYCLSR